MMVIGSTMLQQTLIGVATFVVSLFLLTILLMILQALFGGNVATGLGYIKALYPMFFIIGVLWIALGIAVLLLI